MVGGAHGGYVCDFDSSRLFVLCACVRVLCVCVCVCLVFCACVLCAVLCVCVCCACVCVVCVCVRVCLRACLLVRVWHVCVSIHTHAHTHTCTLNHFLNCRLLFSAVDMITNTVLASLSINLDGPISSVNLFSGSNHIAAARKAPMHMQVCVYMC